MKTPLFAHMENTDREGLKCSLSSYNQYNFSQQLQKFSRVHWLIFIVNERTDTWVYGVIVVKNNFPDICPVIDNEFHHNSLWIHSTIASPKGDSRLDPQTTMTKLWRNSWSITKQTHEKLTSICSVENNIFSESRSYLLRRFHIENSSSKTISSISK